MLARAVWAQETRKEAAVKPENQVFENEGEEVAG